MSPPRRTAADTASTSSAGSAAPPLVGVARRLRRAVDRLDFGPPVTHVYDPLGYARASAETYLERYGRVPDGGSREVLLLGMNPGPWGMAQTGVPFGEIAAVRDFLGIEAPVRRPRAEHPKRPIEGFECGRSEVSGRRLWGWVAARFGTAETFFQRFFVWNYCPLVFMEQSGRNRTPDKLPVEEREPLFRHCDRALLDVVRALGPRWAIGVGGFAERRLRAVLEPGGSPAPELESAPRIGTVLHPSPASPLANRGWAERAEQQLSDLGVPLP